MVLFRAVGKPPLGQGRGGRVQLLGGLVHAAAHPLHRPLRRGGGVPAQAEAAAVAPVGGAPHSVAGRQQGRAAVGALKGRHHVAPSEPGRGGLKGGNISAHGGSDPAERFASGRKRTGCAVHVTVVSAYSIVHS